MTDTATPRPMRQLSLGDYLRILRRRKWVVIEMTVLVAAIAIFLSLQQAKVYQASAEVLISREDLAATLTQTQADAALVGDPVRLADTQAALARVRPVALRAIAAAHVPGRTAGALLANSTVTPNPNADLLVFTVNDRDPHAAAVLANAYAAAYTAYKFTLDTASLQSARSQLEARIAALRAQGDKSSFLYRSLVNNEQQLRTMQILQTKNTVVTQATDGAQVKPTPKRNALLGAGFGFLLGIAAAFIWEALDKRVRDEEEIERALGLPLLSRVPEPPRRLQNKFELAMLSEETGAFAEAIRRLATNIEFANPDRRAQVLMITSAVQREGKSTTAANLAVALARAGQTVALVDLDLRQPTLAAFFGIQRLVGLTDVVMRRATLDQALVPIRLQGSKPDAVTNGNGSGPLGGHLSVLPTGPLPATPSDFVGSRTLVEQVLDPLRERFDLVLIDAPPMCLVGDAMSVSPHVDSLIVVSRVGMVDRFSVADLKRQLSTCPAPTLGFVLTGVETKAGLAYGGYFGGSTKSRSGTGRTTTPSHR